VAHDYGSALSPSRGDVAQDVAQQIKSFSDTVRHLAFAGIACVWAFRQGGIFGAELTIQLAIAAFFVVCALATDMLEAALRVLVTARGGTLSVDDSEVVKGWRYALHGSPERVLLLLKLGFVVMGYAWLLAHLYNMIVYL
jgi:hypothetical protein